MVTPRTIALPVTLLASIFLAFVAFSATSQRKVPTLSLAAMASQTRSFQKERQVNDSVRAPESQPNTGACSPASKYPQAITQWCDLIEKTAIAADLSADLIAALMLEESGGDPQAYSRSGAVGLLQVMPRDGLAAGFQCINGPCFSARPTIAELHDPEFNLSYGARMLQALIAREGDLREALKAYGPLDVDYRYADTVLAIQDRYR